MYLYKFPHDIQATNLFDSTDKCSGILSYYTIPAVVALLGYPELSTRLHSPFPILMYTRRSKITEL